MLLSPTIDTSLRYVFDIALGVVSLINVLVLPVLYTELLALYFLLPALIEYFHQFTYLLYASVYVRGIIALPLNLNSTNWNRSLSSGTDDALVPSPALLI